MGLDACAIPAHTPTSLDDDLTLTSQGRMFLSGTGMLTLAAAGNVRLLLTNTAAVGGKIMAVAKLSIFATASAFGELYINPTAVPTAVRPVNNLFVGNPVVPVGAVHADTNTTTALSGGTDSGVSVGIPASVHEDLLDQAPPILLVPGLSLGINVAFSGVANATVNVYWVELDVLPA